MVEDKFSIEMVDDIIDGCDLESGGAFTAVGTYDYSEFLKLLRALARLTELPAPDLARQFGEHLFGRFAAGYPQFFEGDLDAFSFLKQVEEHIHVEVLKLYPDAELPSFEWSQPTDSQLDFVYRSARPFADLAEGLILGCLSHFKESAQIERYDDDTGAQFRLTRES